MQVGYRILTSICLFDPPFGKKLKMVKLKQKLSIWHTNCHQLSPKSGLENRLKTREKQRIIRSLKAAVWLHEWSQFQFYDVRFQNQPLSAKVKETTNFKLWSQTSLVMLLVHSGQSLLLQINRLRASPTGKCIRWNGLGSVVEGSRIIVKRTIRLIRWFAHGRLRWWAGCPCCPQGCHLRWQWWRLTFQGHPLCFFTCYNETAHNHLIGCSNHKAKESAYRQTNEWSMEKENEM